MLDSTTSADDFSPIRWEEGRLHLLDQTRLPREEVWLECPTASEVARAIRMLSVRGAPAIGVAAAYGLVLAVQGVEADELQTAFEDAFELLAATRPTAVNLRWALDQGRRIFDAARERQEDVGTALLEWARQLQRDDVETNRRIGAAGEALFQSGDRVLTHCNTGALATAGYGTALGVIRSSWDHGRLQMVWVDETRPLLQGARLTAWELERLDIPYRLVTDSSVGTLMAQGLVDRVVLGADRIAANGDVANKIGTYTVAVLAHRHGVPFYVAAPLSTIDPETPSGREIPIEERSPAEVKEVFGTAVSPVDAEAMNFAFDITPNELISGIITEAGVLTPPYGKSIAEALAGRVGA
jgi:methylthioribose-1-phosphate isomerase